MRPIAPARSRTRRALLIATFAAVAVMAVPGLAEAREQRKASWSAFVAKDDLRWELKADRRKGIRLACSPVERTHVWGDNYRRHDCWAGWGQSRTWYRTAYTYRAAAWPSFYKLTEQDFGWCKVGKKWRRVVHVHGHHIQKCKSSRRNA